MQVTEKHLRYFKNAEFVREGRNWLPMYNPRLLILLDVFRHLTGPCILSPHNLALGRMSYPKNPRSQHIYDSTDGVRAVDCFPYIEELDLPFGSNLENNASRWYEIASSIGINGIIIYPNWTYKGKKRIGAHFDIRPEPFHRGYVNGQLVPIEQALEKL